MKRSKQTIVAAILQLVLSAANMVLAFPDLAKGATPASGGSSGYVITVLNFAIYTMGLVAVYGIWKNGKWGKTLAIAVDAVGALLLLPAIVFVPPVGKVLGSVFLLWNLLVIVLLLRSTPRPATA